MFLELGFDSFHLTRASRVYLPGGRPVFPDVPAHSPEDLLARHGLRASSPQSLDPQADVTLVTWQARPRPG
jgi:hypothetical protein